MKHALMIEREPVRGITLLAMLTQMGIDPWAGMMIRRPSTLVNLMCAHASLYAFFSSIPNLWIRLLEDILMRDTSGEYINSYVFLAVQYHSLFEDGYDSRTILLSLAMTSKMRWKLERILYYEVRNDIFQCDREYEDRRSFASLASLSGVDCSASCDTESIFSQLDRCEKVDTKRPKLIRAYARLIIALRPFDTFLPRLANDKTDESIYSLITRSLCQSVDIIAEDDGETYRLSLPSITRRVNKKEADTLICLMEEVNQLTKEITTPDRSKNEWLNRANYYNPVFGPQGLYNTSEKQRALFFSEAGVMRDEYGEEGLGISCSCPKYYYPVNADDIYGCRECRDA